MDRTQGIAGSSEAVAFHHDSIAERQRRRSADQRFPYNTGRLAAEALKRLGVGHLFTLSGGHIFPLFDGCVEQGIHIVDHRHEEAATHAAEAYAKFTRRPGVAAVTAGPGVTNAVTSIAAAQFNRSPLLLLAGRAPDFRWGQGSLQEYDHVPLMSAITKSAATVHDGDRAHIAVFDAYQEAMRGAPGPTFLDIPLDTLVTAVENPPVEWPELSDGVPGVDLDAVARAAGIINGAQRPVIMAGSGAYWHHAEGPLRELAERAGVPVYMNGLGRGLVPADHPNAFSRSRGAGLGGADVVILLGTPLDFRLNFGGSPPFADGARLVRFDALASDLNRNREDDAGVAGNIGVALTALVERIDGGADRESRRGFMAGLRDRERAAEEKDRALLESDATPIHPLRIYGELARRLDRDAVVIGDGGDFISYAGKYVATYQPGRFIDPGPFGGLGMGAPSAIAARLAHPDKQVLLLLGDGAAGFSLMEFDTMVRHRLPVVAVVGNNSAWGLEKHPMEMMYGWSVAAELNPNARYDRVVEALG
ncbi:MAG: acetolactate synthase, partial [Candidatus Dormibacteraeota bacterium]|nr:acetolactate synthase [Candidatus Dormibacteraeota bacterium]